MTKYIAACGIVFAIFILLKFIQDSPIRSWKSALLGTVILSVIVCGYLNFVIPKPTPPSTRKQKTLRYSAELQRNFSHMEGVSDARIEGTVVTINYAEEKTLDQMRRIAHTAGGTANYFLRNEKDYTFTISICIKGEKRFEVLFGPKGVLGEQKF